MKYVVIMSFHTRCLFTMHSYIPHTTLCFSYGSYIAELQKQRRKHKTTVTKDTRNTKV